jgi:hypothetical protein
MKKNITIHLILRKFNYYYENIFKIVVGDNIVKKSTFDCRCF